MNGLVSIIIPVYGAEPYICQALDSVVNQTYQNLQIILVDDGSPDNCGKICDEYAQRDSRIQVIHKENGGVSSARNAGMDAATGEWIYFMDSDDWIELNTVELALDSARKTGADMAFFAFDYVDPKRRYKRHTLNHIDETKEHFWDDLADVHTFLTFNCGGACTSIIRLERIMGKVRFDSEIKAFEDSMFRTDCYPHIRSFSYIPNICYHYRYTPGSATNGKIDPVKYLNDARVRSEQLKNYAYLFSEKEPLQMFACNEYLNAVSRMSITVIPSKTISLTQKQEYIQNAVHSPYYEECFRFCNKAFTGKMVRLSALFGKPTFGSICFAYYCRRVYFALLSSLKTVLQSVMARNKGEYFK